MSRENLDEVLQDFHYGIEAEVDEFRARLMERFQINTEGTMSETDTIRPSNSPEPTSIQLPVMGDLHN